MVPITKGDRLFELEHLVVLSDSGEYGDVDLILCGDPAAPHTSEVMYQAQFIRYGGIVYRFETPEALGEALIVVDKDSTHDAAQLWREDEARRLARVGGKLAPENPTSAPDAVEQESPVEEERTRRDEAEAVQEETMQEAVEEDAIGGGGLGDDVPVPGMESVIDVPVEPVPVTEPVIDVPAELAPEPAVDLSTTTPE